MGIFDAFFNSNKNTDRGYGQALNTIGFNKQVTDPFYKQTLGTAGQANTALADALGLNGTAASQSAQANFRNNPGYQFALDQGTAAIDQSAIASGRLNSGSTLKDLTRYGQGMADQTYNQYLSNLSGLNNGGFAAGSALNGQANQIAGLQVGQGQARDQGNADGLSNLLGLAGTATGYFSGNGLGKLF